MKHLALLAAAGSMAVFAAPAQAADLAPAPIHSIFDVANASAAPLAPGAAFGRGDWDDDDDWRDRRGNRGWRGRGRDRDWDGRYWRGDDGRLRCRRGDGTVGLLIGAGVGALLGREVDRRGDRALGTIIGAVGGGILGREISRGDVRCR